MKKYPITSPAELISQLDEHLEKHQSEPVVLTLDTEDYLDWFCALGLFDAIRAYSKFMDLSIELGYPSSTYLTFVVAAALPREKVFLTDSFFVIFRQPNFFVHGTKTDVRIMTDAFSDVQERTLEIVAVALDEETPSLTRWLNDGKIIKGKDYFSQLGYKYLGEPA